MLATNTYLNEDLLVNFILYAITVLVFLFLTKQMNLLYHLYFFNV